MGKPCVVSDIGMLPDGTAIVLPVAATLPKASGIRLRWNQKTMARLEFSTETRRRARCDPVAKIVAARAKSTGPRCRSSSW